MSNKNGNGRMVSYHLGAASLERKLISTVMKSIENEDDLWASKNRRREKRRLCKEQKGDTQPPEGESVSDDRDSSHDNKEPILEKVKKPPSFY